MASITSTAFIIDNKILQNDRQIETKKIFSQNIKNNKVKILMTEDKFVYIFVNILNANIFFVRNFHARIGL